MDILDFTYDLEKRVKGVRIPVGKDAYLIIAESETPEFWEAYRRISTEITGDTEQPTIEQSKEIYCKTLSECVLLGWGGITENGEPIEYSKEKAYEWLRAEDKEKFFDKVISESKRFSNFQAERIEKEKKP